MIPKKLGRFEVTKELGRGAMGVVYKATDPKIQRPVALKVINFQQTISGDDQLQARERFFVEARATGQLNHPNILTIYDVGEKGDLAYIAMEYLDGGDLQDMIDGSKFEDYDQIYDIVCQIADGLESAHAKGIIHRDIKPANILMLKGRIPKIADFGLARLADSNLTATGTVLGTPNYMAPEQIQGRKIDGRADLFALGALFYEMLTGEKPFGGETLTSVIYRVVNEEPIPPRQLTMDVPPTVDQFMKKALAKDPNARFQSAGEFIKGIKLIREGKPIEGVSSAGTTQKLDSKSLAAAIGKKNNMPLIIGGAVGIIALVVILVALFGGGGKEEPKVAQMPETAQAPPKPASSKLTVTKVEPPKDVRPEGMKKKEGKAAGAKKETKAKKEEKKKKAAIATSKLSVISTPKGAYVYINGKLMGKTPYLDRRYKQKKFTLKVSKKGYVDHVKKFSLKGDRTFKIALNKTKETLKKEAAKAKAKARAKAKTVAKAKAEAKEAKKKKGFWGKVFDKDVMRVVINVKAGDKVAIDGKEQTLGMPDNAMGMGEETFGDERVVETILKEGKHYIKVTRKGKKTYVKIVELKKGETLKLTPKFK